MCNFDGFNSHLGRQQQGRRKSPNTTNLKRILSFCGVDDDKFGNNYQKA